MNIMKASHRNAQESIPWMVTGRLSTEDRRTLEKHMNECEECRKEFALQQKVHAAIIGESPRVDYAPGASLQKLWARIGADEPLGSPHEAQTRSPAPTPRLRLPHWRLTHWLAAAVIVEAIGITLLAVRPLPTTTVNVTPPALFATVTGSSALPGNAVLRVVFAGDLSVTEMSTLLQAHRLTVVDGPKPGNIYTLATADAMEMLPPTLAALRANPKIRLAEPIGRASELSTSQLAAGTKAEKRP